MEPLTFVAAAFALLSTPGPTNTLLATASAALGLRPSLPFIIAVVAAYVVAITFLNTTLAPVIEAVPELGIAVSVGLALYLLYLAVKLWRRDGAADAVGPVTFSRIFIATLLNPKSFIIALTFLPADIGWADLIRWLALLAVPISVASLIWLFIGFVLRHGLSGVVSARTGYRISAIVLAVFAGIVSIRAAHFI